MTKEERIDELEKSNENFATQSMILIQRNAELESRMRAIEERQWEALEIINALVQACSYADKMNNVMFKIPLELANKAEKFLAEENYYAEKCKEKEQ